MRNKIYSLTLILLFALTAKAQHYDFRGDTLVLHGTDSLPKFVVILTDTDTLNYKRVADIATLQDHITPADSMYQYIWTDERVNPYHFPLDSIKDSIQIDCNNFTMPVRGYITSPFGQRRYRYHYGTDIKLQIGDTVRAAWDGQVRIVRSDPKGYGNFVVIRHDNGLETVYGHLSRALVEPDEFVSSGEVIALGGNTGRSTGPHLHFEIRFLGNAINTEYLVDYNRFQMKDSVYYITLKGTFPHYQQLKELQQAKYITIRQGDNLSTLAKRYNTTVKTLCRLNGIKETSILRIGQKLRVR